MRWRKQFAEYQSAYNQEMKRREGKRGNTRRKN